MDMQKYKNNYLITCCSCIVLLLMMCYLGVNDVMRGTRAATACPSGYSAVSNATGVCCPSGYSNYNTNNKLCYAQRLDIEADANIGTDSGTVTLYTAVNSNGGVICYFYQKSSTTPQKSGFQCTSSGTANIDGTVTYRCETNDPQTYCSKAPVFLEKEQYYIQYNLNGGKSGVSKPSAGEINSWLTIDNPTFNFYTLNFDLNGTGAELTGMDSITKSLTFKGWTFNGNTATAEYGIQTGSQVTAYRWNNTSLLVAPSYKQFKNLASTGATVTLTANWETVYYGFPTVTKSGAECGWSTSKTAGTDKIYDSGYMYPFSGGDNVGTSLTFYAICKDSPKPSSSSQPSSSSSKPSSSATKTTFTATYYNGDKYFDKKECTTTAGGNSCTMPLPTGEPVKTGYTFTGWGDSKTCENGTKSTFTVSSNVNKYACFKENPAPSSSSQKPSSSSKVDELGNVTDNSDTGDIAIFLMWVIGLAVVVYSVWYFKRIREN